MWVGETHLAAAKTSRSTGSSGCGRPRSDGATTHSQARSRSSVVSGRPPPQAACRHPLVDYPLPPSTQRRFPQRLREGCPRLVPTLDTGRPTHRRLERQRLREAFRPHLSVRLRRRRASQPLHLVCEELLAHRQLSGSTPQARVRCHRRQQGWAGTGPCQRPPLACSADLGCLCLRRQLAHLQARQRSPISTLPRRLVWAHPDPVDVPRPARLDYLLPSNSQGIWSLRMFQWCLRISFVAIPPSLTAMFLQTLEGFFRPGVLWRCRDSGLHTDSTQ
mmetsp:Transcript_49826/g.132230  ORF Transcript_49826/g.132230 Transcript_49826/m.132230 type:complete len:276 (-) Transcript_49826:115-942(-)